MTQKGFVPIFFIIVILATSSFFVAGFYLGRITKGDQKPLVSHETSEKEPAYIERGSSLDHQIEEESTAGGKARPDIYFHGPRDSRRIALTFDAEMTDGMRADLKSGRVKSSYDRRIIDILNQTNTKATLFLTGMWIELYPEVTWEMAHNPLFELGSHSYSDTSYQGYCYGLKQIPDTQDKVDIEKTQKLLKEGAGINNYLFRFPGGCYSKTDLDIVKKEALVTVHWDVSGTDGFNKKANLIVKNVIDNVQNGSIIILHLNGAPNAPKTAEALPTIIATLKDRGFKFVTVSDLLNL